MTLVKIIADLAIFFEFTDEELLDPDAAISALEQVAAELQLLGADGRKTGNLKKCVELKRVCLQCG